MIKYTHKCSKGHTFKKLVFGFKQPPCEACEVFTREEIARLLGYEQGRDFAAKADVFLNMLPAVKRKAQVFAKPATSSRASHVSSSGMSSSLSHIPYTSHSTPSFIFVSEPAPVVEDRCSTNYSGYSSSSSESSPSSDSSSSSSCD